MPRKTELLTKALEEARALDYRGDSAMASNICRLLDADVKINILDKLTEIEKHLAAIATPFEEAIKDGQSINLEQVKPAAKAKGS
jgi:hypothetical protein